MLKATRPHSQMDNRASLKATIIGAAHGPLSAATSLQRLLNLKDDISAVCGFMGPASLRGEEARTFVIDTNEVSRVVTSALIDTLYSSSPTQMEVIITPSDPRVARWTVAEFIQRIVDTLIASLQAARSLTSAAYRPAEGRPTDGLTGILRSRSSGSESDRSNASAGSRGGDGGRKRSRRGLPSYSSGYSTDASQRSGRSSLKSNKSGDKTVKFADPAPSTSNSSSSSAAAPSSSAASWQRPLRLLTVLSSV